MKQAACMSVICNNKRCYVQVNKGGGRCSQSEAEGQQAGVAGSKGHTLDVVTLTAELSSENKPLR